MGREVDALALEDTVGRYRKDPRLERQEKLEAKTVANFGRRRPGTVEEQTHSESNSDLSNLLWKESNLLSNRLTRNVDKQINVEKRFGSLVVERITLRIVHPCNCGKDPKHVMAVRAGEYHPRCFNCGRPVRSDGGQAPVLIREAEVGEAALVEDKFHGGQQDKDGDVEKFLVEDEDVEKWKIDEMEELDEEDGCN